MKKQDEASPGFTTVLIVIIIAILVVAIILPRVLRGPKARENALKAHLAEMRSAIQLYEDQHGIYPASLDALTKEVNKSTGKTYLEKIPVDPLTRTAEYNYNPVNGKLSSKAEGDTLDKVPYKNH